MADPQLLSARPPQGWFRPLMLGLLTLFLATNAVAYDYAFPIDNPYLATIAGTPEALIAEVPEKRIRERRLNVRSAHARRTEVPRCLPFPDRLEYSLLAQKQKSAPLTFLIAGTGSDHRAGSVALLMRALYGAGHHVVGLPSPTHPRFVASASSSGVPGDQRRDAEDLYRVMAQIRRELEADGIQASSFRLAGYSLGGLNAAFVAALDARQRQFDFHRTLLINAPVSLYSSISKLDRFLDNVPGGVDNLDRLFNEVLERLGEAYQRSSNVEFTDELIYSVFKDAPPTQEAMAALIGAAFRFAAMNLSFTADLVSDYGFLKPRGLELGARVDLSPYLAVALRVGLTDYFHEFFWPEQQRLGNTGELDRFAYADQQGLAPLSDFLRGNPRIYATHNADDVILEAGEIAFFKPVFGSRVQIYPNGGHLGNLSERSVVEHIVTVLSGS
ncbi:MAG: alpha/beta hydrolase [Pseudomonadota bacterium]